MINLKMIKNIIFDLGGVILNINPRLSLQAFKELGLDNLEEMILGKQVHQLLTLFETGKTSPETFRQELKKLAGKEIRDSDIDEAWKAMILDIPVERIHLLERLKKEYRIFLLSNTNSIHLEKYNGYFKNQPLYNDLSDLFEKAYYSHEIGYRKPDKEAYLFVLKKHGLEPGETLFIDDSLQNIEAANELGIKGYNLQHPETLLEVFNDM